jgi:hypothetical protein
MNYFYKNVNISNLFDQTNTNTNINTYFTQFPSFTTTTNLAGVIDAELPYNIQNVSISSKYSILGVSQQLNNTGNFNMPSWCNSIKTIMQKSSGAKGSSGNNGTTNKINLAIDFGFNKGGGTAPITNPGNAPINNPAVPGNWTPGTPGTAPINNAFGNTTPGIPGTNPIYNGIPATVTPGTPTTVTPGIPPFPIGINLTYQNYVAPGGQGGEGGDGGSGLSIQIQSPTPYTFNTATNFSYSVNNTQSQLISSNNGALITLNNANNGNSGNNGNDGTINYNALTIPGFNVSLPGIPNVPPFTIYNNIKTTSGTDGNVGSTGTPAQATVSNIISGLTINQTPTNTDNNFCQLYYFYT